MKTELTFAEVEHEGDMETYIEDIKKSGGHILDHWINPEDEQGTAYIMVENPTDFLAKFNETESVVFVTNL